MAEALVDTIRDGPLNDLDDLRSYVAGVMGKRNCDQNVKEQQNQKCSICEAQVQVLQENIRKHDLFGEQTDSQNPSHFTLTLRCPKCNKDVAVYVGNKWYKIKDLLTANETLHTGLVQVRTPYERLILYVLSQLVYRQQEATPSDPEYLPCPRDERAFIMWQKGEAIGFYTVKPKGSLYSQKLCCVYDLAVLDLMFVRKAQRRHGLATQMLQHFVNSFPNQPLGVSTPVSDNMYAVIHKYLMANPSMRDLLWETSFTGAEGYRENIWFHLKRVNREQQQVEA